MLQSDVGDHRAAIYRLDHVVQCQRGNGYRRQRLHLHARLAGDGYFRFDLHALVGDHGIDTDAGNRKRVTERDQLARFFSRHNAGDARHSQCISFRNTRIAEQTHRLRVQTYPAFRHRVSRGIVLSFDVHHTRVSLRIQVRQIIHIVSPHPSLDKIPLEPDGVGECRAPFFYIAGERAICYNVTYNIRKAYHTLCKAYHALFGPPRSFPVLKSLYPIRHSAACSRGAKPSIESRAVAEVSLDLARPVVEANVISGSKRNTRRPRLQVPQGLKFDANGLIPAVVQDADNGDVLMVGYMNQEAVERTIQTGRVTFWSRSRQKYWVKGETSGNIQRVKDLFVDCDQDCLLVKAEQVGAACHEGYRSCFFRRVAADGETLDCIAEPLVNPY